MATPRAGSHAQAAPATPTPVDPDRLVAKSLLAWQVFAGTLAG